jgi:hypothetical protein
MLVLLPTNKAIEPEELAGCAAAGTYVVGRVRIAEVLRRVEEIPPTTGAPEACRRAIAIRRQATVP